MLVITAGLAADEWTPFYKLLQHPFSCHIDATLRRQYKVIQTSFPHK